MNYEIVVLKRYLIFIELKSNLLSGKSVIKNKRIIMRPNSYFVVFALLLLFVLAYCSDQFVPYDDPELLQSEDFTFIPQTPENNKEVSMVYYGCEYYETTSVSRNEKSVLVVKKFNGAMKRPCILGYDTISLGTLSKGTYLVTLNIIDINPFAQDSLFSTETKKLIIN